MNYPLNPVVSSVRLILKKDGYKDKELSVLVSKNISRTYTLEKEVKKLEVDLTQFSGTYKIPRNNFCTDCPTSYFVLTISQTSVKGRWNLAPGQVSYKVTGVISRSSTSMSLALTKEGFNVEAPSKLRIDLEFLDKTMKMVL